MSKKVTFKRVVAGVVSTALLFTSVQMSGNKKATAVEEKR